MSWVDYLVGGGSATVIGSGMGTLAVKYLKHVVNEVVTAAIKDVADGLAELKLKFASETGGNSNGLRQKINEVDAKLDTVVETVAHLKGSLGQP